ncbi:MAG: glycosyltransferase family 4 protein [Leptolyngbyaceae cyanobacterium SU_3_3]|nr:glycosyltransferase family 4 protein [Leptolyngbyaceae cyanobacterium SU_3_3]NJR48856.1 glycosyltransferase family 4 protein [Leptolyngbyaceae cyanobacterium CSU_1_3]
MRKPILTIFFQFNPWRSSIGGIQTIIRSFIKYAPDEFDVRVVGTGDELSQSLHTWQEAEFAGRAIQFMPLFKLQNDNHRKLIPTTTLRYAAALLGRDLASDFMHFHRLEPTLATRRWRGEKTLFLHNDIQQYMAASDGKKVIPWRHFPAAYFALEKSLVRQFDQILSCHTGSLELYRQRYPDIADRVAYIQNSFDDEIFYPLPKSAGEAARRDLAQQLNLPETTRFILFAGRLHPQKDPILLLRSIAALQEANVHLLVAGDGEMAADMQAEVIRLNLSDRVTLLGALEQPQVAKLHQISSVFVLTSSFEGLPLVALETLACGTPIVTTDCGDTPRLLTANSGIVCKERTPSTIAAALRQVLQHPEDYPVESCALVAQPHTARAIVNRVYADMLTRWEQRGVSDRVPDYVR